MIINNDLNMFLNLRESTGVNHPKFGNLARPQAVDMRDSQYQFTCEFKEDESIMIHLTVTGRCYAQCKGCINSAITMASDKPRNLIISSQESEPERDATIIRELVSRLPDQTITVCFYGGEPFLAADKMDRLAEMISRSEIGNRIRYMVYTTGELFIDAIRHYPQLIQNMWLYSISIDGNKDQHNRVRPGTRLNKIIENLKHLRAVYKGNVLQWSTLREEQSLLNCFEQFMELYHQKLVNHFFWHWAEMRESFEDLQVYMTRYGQELEAIMDVYLQKLFEGELLPITHVNELILYLITGKERGHTACGVELAQNYDIVAGKVHACADLPSSLAIGELNGNGNLNLRECDLGSLVKYKDVLGCYQCGVHPYCGGRCPVQALAGSPERTLQYCQLMRLHVGVVKERIGDILKALDRNGIPLQDIYDRSAFLTKYTDVVP